MTTFLSAAVVLLALLVAVDLLLTFGVIRRLREHTEQLATMQAKPAITSLAVGDGVGDFESLTVDGLKLTKDNLTGDTLVAFFSTSCSACHERLPEFLEHFTAVGGNTRVLVVVAGPAEKTPTMVPALIEAATVIREDDDQDGMSTAFAVRGYPVLFQLANDKVTAFGTTTSALSAPVTV